MAMSDAPPPKAVSGHTDVRHTLGLIGQYGALCLLSLLVLGPLFLTVVQALSPPFTYVNEGRPLHPVAVDWKDRTWWTGGVLSVVVRTALVAFTLAWAQKAAAWGSWKDLRWLGTPSRLVAVIGGTLAVAFASTAAFESLDAADGRSGVVIIGGMALVAATQLWGFRDAGRVWWSAVVMAVSTGFLVVGSSVLFFGPEVWTKTWSKYDLGPAMGRSLVMTVIITVLQVVTATLGAYAFVFLRFPFKRLIFALFMATLLLPLEVTLVGNIATIRQLEWINTMQALVFPFAATAFGTFLIRQGFRGLPSEIQDATRLDGYSHLAFLWKFAVPLTRPVIASFTVIAALQAWNQYLWPRSVIESNAYNTLQIQLRNVAAGQVANANEAIASALVAAIPVVIMLLAFQRQIIRGLTAGAVK
jgi:sn-glycerol 3-phosphate transport system permease protein